MCLMCLQIKPIVMIKLVPKKLLQQHVVVACHKAFNSVNTETIVTPSVVTKRRLTASVQMK